jgi:hypothetical protein
MAGEMHGSESIQSPACRAAWRRYGQTLAVAGADKPGGASAAADRLRQQGRAGIAVACSGHSPLDEHVGTKND